MEGVARYDPIAEFYHQRYKGTPLLLHYVGDVGGRRVLDIACGYGRAARELARRGAVVTGVDLSRELLDIARQRELDAPLGIAYLQGDCCSPDLLADELFDVITCSEGLADIDDLDGCLRTVARLLRIGGTFSFSIFHPCFPGSGSTAASWPADGGYHHEGWWAPTSPESHPGLRAKVGANHRTLSTYLNAVIRHGLLIAEIAEPVHPDFRLLPWQLIARCLRT